jgi:hypothetical protein
MNDIVADHPDTAIHMILDNLNTHKPKNDRWLKCHPTVHFHFTLTRAFWLELRRLRAAADCVRGRSPKMMSYVTGS